MNARPETAAGNRSEPMGDKDAVADSRSTPMADKDAVADSRSTPMADKDAVADSRSTPMADKDAVADSRSAPMADKDAVADSRSTPMGDRETIAGSRSTPMADKDAVAGSRCTPMADKDAVAGSRSTPMGDRETIAGSRSTPMGDKDAVAGSRSTPMGDRETIAGSRSTPMGDRETIADDRSSPGTNREMTHSNSNSAEWKTGAPAFRTLNWESPSQEGGCGSAFRPIAGDGKFMYVDVGQVAGVFACQECEAAFAEPGPLEQHRRRTHAGQGLLFRCPQCHAAFADSRLLDEHTLLQHSFPSPWKVQEQTGKVSGSGQVIDTGQVSDCGTQSDSDVKTEPLSESDSETGSDSGNTTAAATAVGETGSLGSAGLASQRPLDNRFFSCKTCPLTFPNAKSLARHVKLHRGGEKTTGAGEKTLPCRKKTLAAFQHPSALMRPAEVQAAEPTEGLDSAAKAGFVAALNLGLGAVSGDAVRRGKTKRVRSSPPDREGKKDAVAKMRKFSCTECKLTFKQSGSLNEHMRVHTGERPYPCPHCAFSFKRSTHLKTHIVRKHSPTPSSAVAVPREAQVAVSDGGDTVTGSRSAAQPTEAQAVAAAGEGKSGADGGFTVKTEPLSESDAEMEVGGEAAGGGAAEDEEASSSLGASEEIKAADEGAGKRLSCSECSVTFKQSGSLNAHMRIHTGARPFPCQRCQLSFRRSTHLKNHMVRKHDSAADTTALDLGETQAAEVVQSAETRRAPLATGGQSGVSAALCGFAAVKAEPPPPGTDTTDVEVVEEEADAENGAASHEGACRSAAEVKQRSPAQRRDQRSQGESFPPPPQLQPQCGGVTASDIRRLQTTGERPHPCPHCMLSFKRATHLKTHLQKKHASATRDSAPALREKPTAALASNNSQQAAGVAAEERPPADAELVIKEEPPSPFDADTGTDHASRNNSVGGDGGRPPPAVDIMGWKRVDKRERPDDGDRRYSCSECRATFKQSGSLNEHMRVHTGERPFPCTQCPLSFKRSTHLKTHILRKHTVLEMEGTPEGYDADAAAPSGTDTFAPSDGYHPDLQKKGPGSKKYTGGKEPTFHCSECPASFVYPCELNQHARTHTGERPFTCHLCQATFARSGNMKAHMRIHTGVKPFGCAACHETFALASKLKSHTLRKHTPGTLLQFHCADCDASFVYRSELKKHRRSHLVHKPFPCGKCAATFGHPGGLNTHLLRKHSTGQLLPYPCPSCDSSFMSLGELKRHGRVHTGERPFPCGRCEETFAQSGTLKRHMARKHSVTDDS